MEPYAVAEMPHAVCVPFPAQGHINPLLKLAKLLYSKGFHITFINTEFNHNRLIKSRGLASVKGLPRFRFETIPDGLQLSDTYGNQNLTALCKSTTETCIGPFRDLLAKLNKSPSSPAVTCIIADACMSFTLQAADELGIPEVIFWTLSSCGVMAYLHYRQLVESGYTPLKDESYLTNGYLDTPINSIPGMEDIRLRDIPSFIRTTDANDIMLNFLIQEAERCTKASGIVINTFHAFESAVLDAMKPLLPPIYTIGPLQLLMEEISSNDDGLKSLGANLWKEDEECIKWLDSKPPNSVVYVNFGSVIVMTSQQLVEFAWGLANSKHHFLWVIRADLVREEKAILPPEFTVETKERSLIASWCPQEQVLKHPSVGGFLTHSGWNSTLDTICGGVPVISWPLVAEQQTNCRFTCTYWGIGMEIDNNVKRDEVESLVKELMEGDKGKEMRKRAMKWKKSAEESARPGGSSCVNLDKLVNEVLLSSRREEISLK